jgi:hypothetical protein
MRCLLCYSNDCIHVHMGMQGMAGQMGAQQQSMQQYYAALRNYAGTEMANVLGQEMAKAYVAKSKKKLLLLRK